MKKGKRVVLLQGTFDIINWGHIKAFELAKSYGDYLIVALNTNELVQNFKRRKPVLPWYQKAFIISSCRFVDEVVPAPCFSPIALLREYEVDVYCITEEWESTKKTEMKYMSAQRNGEVKFLPRFEGVVCTSDIKRILLEEAQEEKLKTKRVL